MTTPHKDLIERLEAVELMAKMYPSKEIGDAIAALREHERAMKLAYEDRCELQSRIEQQDRQIAELDGLLTYVLTWDVVADKMEGQGNDPDNCNLAAVLCAARKLVRIELQRIKEMK